MTLSEYMNFFNTLQTPLSVYHGDFFPYTQYTQEESPIWYDHYWGGYFTSRPSFKR